MSDDKKYELPKKYQRLLTTFGKLDFVLFILTQKGCPRFANGLLRKLDARNSETSSAMKEIKQMLFAYADCYEVKWAQNEKEGSQYEIELNFPLDEGLNNGRALSARK